MQTKTDSSLELKPSERFVPLCRLKWRQNQLWVKQPNELNKTLALPALENDQWLVECLQHSPVQIVCLSPRLGENEVLRWANACEQANKIALLRVKTKPKTPLGGVGRILERSITVLILLILSPLILTVALLMRMDSPGAVFSRQWQVGEGGRLFRGLRFSTTPIAVNNSLANDNQETQLSFLKRWLHAYHLDELPQLINVLRGQRGLLQRRLSLHEVMSSNADS